MKIRTGFVSNSSSSSFIIGSKKEIDENSLVKIFKTKEGDLFHPFSKLTSEIIYRHSKKFSSIEEYKKETYGEPSDFVKNIFDKGMILYTGSVPDFGDGGDVLEAAVCKMKFSYSDKNIIIDKDNTY